MGYVDALARGAFKRTASGKIAFYPWGKVGRGYEIQTDEQYDEIHRFIVRYYIVVLPITAGAAVLLKWFALAVVPFVAVPYVLWLRRWTRILPTTDERMTFRESFEAQAAAHSPAMLCVLLVISLAFVLAGAAIVMSGRDILTGLSCAVFFGCCAAVFGFMISARRRSKRDTG